jgi:opacity protein-like surface antigen
MSSVVAKTALVIACLISSGPLWAQGNYYLKPHAGFSMAQDNDFGQNGVAGAGATGDGSYDGGFATGLAFGYRYGNGFSAEIDWEYRRNDIDSVVFSDGTRFSKGDLASNIVSLNVYYTFAEAFGKVRPFIGAGIGWVEEVDLDLESGGVENSYSSDGDIAWRLMAGLETPLAQNWRLQGEVRYTRVAGVDLEQESGTGRITDLDYDTWTVGIGVIYDF